ncbi:response regulator [Aquimarina addita]|uniref:Response regulator n=1 Tax=Aquimarina addita TaxID=870485 RepID=A0ABP6UKB0_9FLAO
MQKMDLTFLLIEDDEIERMKFSRVLKQNKQSHKVVEAKNGEEALEKLKDTNNLPDVILLDLNMPRMNGLEFLKVLKADEVLKFIPAVILSTSSNHQDIMESYKTGIAGYIMKPLKYEDYTTKINSLLTYWSHNELFKN